METVNEIDKKSEIDVRNQISKYLYTFRFDLDVAFPKDGDYSILKLIEGALTVVERNDSLNISILVPSSNTGSILSELLMKCSEITSITVSHHNDLGESVLTTKHTLEKFLGWEILSETNGEKPLSVKLSWLSTPSMVIEQSKEGLEEWLKKGENTTNE